MRSKTAIERFISFVSEDPNTGCWIWIGHTDRDGYGQFGFEQKLAYAHRASYKIFKGDIPPKIYVCHKCDTPSCVNPEHLFLGTHAQNMTDMVMKGRARTPIGSEHKLAKFNENKVIEIKKLLLKGEALNKIAAKFGISASIIYGIKSGKNWKHVILPNPRKKEE